MTPGDIYLVRDWQSSGKGRPVVVVSRTKFNRGRYCLVVPFTTQQLDTRRTFRNCVYFSKGSFGLYKDCVAQAEGITLLRRSDIVPPPQPIGQVDSAKMSELITAVGYVIGADCEPTV